MMEYYKTDHLNPVADIKDDIRLLAESFLRTEPISSNDYYFILFLMLLHREGLFSEYFIEKDWDFKKQIHKSVNNFNGKNADILREIYNFYEPVINKVSDNAIIQIVKTITGIWLPVQKNNFTEIFDYILYRINKGQGKLGGEYILPEDLSRFICSLVELSDNAKVYNPFAGLSSFRVFLDQKIKYLGQEINPNTWTVGMMRILAHDKNKDSEYVLGDSLNNWNPNSDKYDLVISNPPFGGYIKYAPYGMYDSSQLSGQFGRINTYEHFLIEKGMESLNNDGKLIAVISQSFLFTKGAEQNLRNFLIENDLVEMVISFPGGLLPNTGISFAALLINKNKKEKGVVRFVDAKDFVVNLTSKEKSIDVARLNAVIKSPIDNDSLRIVSNDTIRDCDYNFNVSRYFLKQQEGISLGDLGTIVLGIRTAEGKKGKFVRIRDLKEDSLDASFDIESIEEVEMPRPSQKIEESCLLMAARWKSLKPTYFKYSGIPIYITPDIIALKVNEAIVDINYLKNELCADYVTEQIESYSYGATIPSIKKDDLLSVKIKLPDYHNQGNFASSLKEQGLIVQKIKESKRDAILKQMGLEHELQKVIEEQKNDLSIKKHNIMQHLNNVRESAFLLFDVMQKNGGSLDSKVILNPGTNSTVESRFKRMLESINESLFFVDNITNDLKFDKKEVLDIDVLLKDAIEKGVQRNDLFDIEYFYDKESFVVEFFRGDDEEFGYAPNSEVSKKDFFEMYNNIMENAISHGFTEPGRKYKFKIDLCGIVNSNEPCLSIIFSNNGLPFPEGIAERYCMKGEKAGKTGNLGIGTWRVCEIVKNHFGGKVIVHDLKGEEFPVKIEIQIPFYTTTL